MRSVIAETGWLNKSEYFRKSTLIKSEIENEYKLGIDSWVDTSCSEKYSDVDEFVKGKTVMDTRFYSYLVSRKYLTIANVLYEYDTLDRTTIILEHNNTIYMGDMMEYPLTNTLQSEDNGIHIEIGAYPDDSGAQNVTLPYDTIIPIIYDHVIP